MHRSLLAAFLLLAGWPPAQALGRIVFDPSNFTRNVITAAEAVRHTMNQALAHKTQLEQLAIELRQLRSMGGEDVARLLPGQDSEIARLAAAAESLRLLHGSVQGIGQTFSRRLEEAKLQDLTWAQYMTLEEQRILRNQAAATARAQEEIEAMDRIRRDYQFARSMADRIPHSAGTHESMQHLNVQMNQLLKQTADLTRAMAAALDSSRSADMQSQQNVQQLRRLTEQRRLEQLQRAREAGERRALEVLRGRHPQ